MNGADYVDSLIAAQKSHGKPLQDVAWVAALACVGWAYVYGAVGEYCDPTNRRSRYNGTKAGADKDNIKNKCKNFNGKDSVPAGCVGCKWFLGNAESDQTKHVGRTRFFDCRGYVYFILNRVCGMWPKGCPAGCTTMWNTESNWKAKGLVKDGVPDNVLVCLFKQDSQKPGTMAHIGFGYHGETVECSSGVQHYTTRNKKWTHWAIPICFDGDSPTPGTDKPTLRKGDRGAYVTLAQTELINHGYSVGDTGADGIFGNNTEKAVKRFQQENVGEDGTALTVNGIIDDRTWWALDRTDIPLYTVTIPHLSKHHAEALVTNYSGATMTEERG